MAKDLKEQIEIMTHYLNGGDIEWAKTGFDDWGIADDPCWNWHEFDYRKEEPKQKVTIEKWLCRDYHGNFIVIETTGIDEYYYKKVKLIKSYEVEL